MKNRDNYTESEENNTRRREVSLRLLKMGKALMDEGAENDDFCLLSAGNQLILLSGLTLNPKDMEEFSNLSGMFSAKSILDDMMSSPFGLMGSPFGGLSSTERIENLLKNLGNKDENDDSKDFPFNFPFPFDKPED